MTGYPHGEPDWDAVVPDADPPYAGPPSYGPPAYGPPGHGGPAGHPAPGYPVPPYGPPPGWGPAPAWGATPAWGAPPTWGAPPGWGPARPSGPQRPGTAIAAAVLAFTLALLTLLGSVYAAAFSALLTLARRPNGGLDSWTPFAQLLVVAALVAGGILVLGGRRTVLLGAAGAELLLAIWWFVVLGEVAPSGLSGGLGLLPLVFGVLAAVAAALTFTPSAQAWAHQQEAHRARARPAAGPRGDSPAGP